MANISQTMNKIGRVSIKKDVSSDGNWLIRVPAAAMSALNLSTVVSYGTSFSHNSDVTLWQVGGGTYNGAAGTSLGIFVGTGING